QHAGQAAHALGGLCVLPAVPLGESQLYQLRGSLDLYHYVDPKLLLLVAAVRLALDGQPIGDGNGHNMGSEHPIEPGPPARMLPTEMVAEKPDDPSLRAIFADFRRPIRRRA